MWKGVIINVALAGFCIIAKICCKPFEMMKSGGGSLQRTVAAQIGTVPLGIY